MKKTRILAFILVIALVAASAMMIYSCEKTDENTLGKGKTSFKLEVTDDKNETKTFTIKTDEKTLGDALMHDDVKLIALDEWGMVSTVNGLKAEWIGDGTGGWWAVYTNGEMALVGVFDIEIDKDAVYKFEYTKETAFDESAFDDEAVG
ncbi:MAG: DUF4430 domain-containing protein [Oscillospiraceae bacterium]|nr:DUF4430 domain-containing protein [Oscillospiraceae bacterium]